MSATTSLPSRLPRLPQFRCVSVIITLHSYHVSIASRLRPPHLPTFSSLYSMFSCSLHYFTTPTLRSCHVRTTSHGTYVSNEFVKDMLTQNTVPAKEKGNDKGKGKARPLKSKDKGKNESQTVTSPEPAVPTPELTVPKPEPAVPTPDPEVPQAQAPTCGEKMSLTASQIHYQARGRSTVLHCLIL